ncbi:hypothetical protein PMPD1_3727 [Paramixta manurensis]|uniref:Uncharacterized protein n=1 Tax=Paramixta manurensis TaxID=2740817 RepID=A0A6M8UIB3_9GAMM|nr:hypothetical protein PMPD1_3727 [Erwiniaceae bacterium PD-1]
MKRTVLLALLALNIGPASAGDWIFRPVANGRLQISQQGGAEQGPDMLVQRQAEQASLTLQVMPAGMGHCENGVLTGSGPLSSIRIPLVPVIRSIAQPGLSAQCGESLQFDAPAQSQLVGVKAAPRNERIATAAIPAALSGQRILLGYVNFIQANSQMASNAIYLDLSTLSGGVPSLQAAFDKPSLRFGEVNVLKNSLYNAKLTIRKTAEAGDAAVPYELTFESRQQRENSFQLKDTRGEIFVPYQIKIGSYQMTPGAIYTGLIPAGSATADIIGINFSLSGKNISGLAAGTRLTDTLTAVITPTS